MKRTTSDLLNPYLSKEQIHQVWKEYLTERSRPGTFTEMEKLAKEIIKDFKVPREAIRSLFNRDHVEEVPSFKIPELKVLYQPYNFVGTEKFDYSCPEIIERVKKRMMMPIGSNPKSLGPTNSDEDVDFEAVIWCHQVSNSEDFNVFHAMTKCQCYVSIPQKGFHCEGCQKYVSWVSDSNPKQTEKDFIRFPIVHEGKGGWGQMYCSKFCIFELPPEPMSLIQELILEISIASIK